VLPVGTFWPNRTRPAFEMPQCLQREVGFRGSDRTEFLDNRQFNGNALCHSRARSACCARQPADRRPVRTGPHSAHRRTAVSTFVYASGAGECIEPPRQRNWRRLCGLGSLRRPPGGDVDGEPASRAESGRSIRAARVQTLKPADRPHLPSAGTCRGMGSRHTQDGGTGDCVTVRFHRARARRAVAAFMRKTRMIRPRGFDWGWTRVQ